MRIHDGSVYRDMTAQEETDFLAQCAWAASIAEGEPPMQEDYEDALKRLGVEV